MDIAMLDIIEKGSTKGESRYSANAAYLTIVIPAQAGIQPEINSV
jgi:hypothetical protein